MEVVLDRFGAHQLLHVFHPIYIYKKLITNLGKKKEKVLRIC